MQHKSHLAWQLKGVSEAAQPSEDNHSPYCCQATQAQCFSSPAKKEGVAFEGKCHSDATPCPDEIVLSNLLGGSFHVLTCKALGPLGNK